jgi:hypothetical protein
MLGVVLRSGHDPGHRGMLPGIVEVIEVPSREDIRVKSKLIHLFARELVR